jgi:hypothetical protein
MSRIVAFKVILEFVLVVYLLRCSAVLNIYHKIKISPLPNEESPKLPTKHPALNITTLSIL